MLLVILTVKKLLEHFTKKNCKSANQKELRIKKTMKRKIDKIYVKWKGYDNSFKTGLIYLRENMKVELDLSNYATKADLKEATNVNTSDFAKKTDLANLKSDLEKLPTQQQDVVATS